MNRRGFLKSMLAAAAAPAIVGSGILMPVRKILSATPEQVAFLQSGTGFTQAAYAAILHGDGIRDDAAALEAFLNGLPVLYQGHVVQDRVGHGKFLLGRTVHIRGDHSVLLHDSEIIRSIADDTSPMLYYHEPYPFRNLESIYLHSSVPEPL